MGFFGMLIGLLLCCVEGKGRRKGKKRGGLIREGERGGRTDLDDQVSRLMSAPRMRLSVRSWVPSVYSCSVLGGLTMTGSMRTREEKSLGNICAARVLGGWI